MTLYRKMREGEVADVVFVARQAGKPRKDQFILVPVEPCKHGSYTRHIDKDEIITDNLYPEIPWCPGAGLKEET